MQNEKKPRTKLYLNLAFILLCAGLLFFLALAPEESTSRLPHDENHERFHAIKSKKEADKLCVECHSESGGIVLPDDHPPPYRCLFCHKRDA